MARFLKGIHGAYSGKVGNVVGSSWRSVNYVRTLPKKSAKTPTQGQLAQREKFSILASFLSPIQDLLNLGYSDSLQTKATGYNKAFGHAIKHAFTGSYPFFDIDYSKLIISRGSSMPLFAASWMETQPLHVELSWLRSTSKIMGYNDDSVILLVYNVDKKHYNVMETAIRQDESLDFSFPSIFAGDTIVGWVFTGERDGVKTSPSYYLGQLHLSTPTGVD